jgi:hypothetical protein
MDAIDLFVDWAIACGSGRPMWSGLPVTRTWTWCGSGSMPIVT